MEKSASLAASRPRHPALEELLRDTNSLGYFPLLAPSEARAANIEKVISPGGVAIVTGQQVGLFLGPLFTIYKCISAVQLAKQVESLLGIPSAPVFWLQTEDHDLDEIRYTYSISQRSEILRLEVPATSEQRVSVRYATFDSSVTRQLELLEESLKGAPFAEMFMGLIKRCYQPGISFVDAFVGLLSTIFPEIVFVDPCHRLAKDNFPFKESISNEQEITARLKAREALLRSVEIPIQVHTRESSPLCFFHPDGATGPRYRFVDNGGQYRLIGGERDVTSEIDAALAVRRSAFSNSALLRPISQDTLLPTAAYIAGAAEIRYFYQIADIYELFGLVRPALLPRAHFLLLEQRSQRLLDELQLGVDDLFLPEEELLNKLSDRCHSTAPKPKELEEEINRMLSQLFGHLSAAISDVDRTLLDPLRKIEEKTVAQLHQIQLRYAKALTLRDETMNERLERVRRLVRPEENEQERYYCAIPFLCRYGSKFIEQLSGMIDPTGFNSITASLSFD